MIEEFSTSKPLSDDIRLEVGKLVFDRFIDEATGPKISEASIWLTELGFEEDFLWNSEGDVLILCLWRFGPDPEHKVLDEFIIEFTGHDAANIALFNLVKEVSL